MCISPAATPQMTTDGSEISTHLFNLFKETVGCGINEL
jgi:hypothetical protein